MDFRQLSHLYCNCLWTQHKNKDEEPEVIESEVNRTEAAAEEEGKDDTVRAVEFESAQFSVYGIIGSYTVDFCWEVDGRTYDFSMPGRGFVSFTDLVEVLDLAGDATGSFVTGRDHFIIGRSISITRSEKTAPRCG